jgi:hypothetical protein
LCYCTKELFGEKVYPNSFYLAASTSACAARTRQRRRSSSSFQRLARFMTLADLKCSECSTESGTFIVLAREIQLVGEIEVASDGQQLA